MDRDLKEGLKGRQVIISLNNLKAGIEWWRKKQGGWGQDFLNGDYYAIYNARSAGATKEWWAATLNRLGQWRAYRGRTAPNTKDEINSRGGERLGLIGAEYTKLMACSGEEPSITNLSWEDVASFYAVVSEIKPRSDVFAGKMCHFTFPKLFIVMDNEATSVFEYEFYWRGMKDEWSRFRAKADAMKLFAEAIRSDKPVHPLYPFETKIIELSHVGYKHG
jgi:hypothetical protein